MRTGHLPRTRQEPCRLSRFALSSHVVTIDIKMEVYYGM
jgi:hypothetical protein